VQYARQGRVGCGKGLCKFVAGEPIGGKNDSKKKEEGNIILSNDILKVPAKLKAGDKITYQYHNHLHVATMSSIRSSGNMGLRKWVSIYAACVRVSILSVFSKIAPPIVAVRRVDFISIDETVDRDRDRDTDDSARGEGESICELIWRCDKLMGL